MLQTNKILAIIILSLITFGLYGQSSSEYENEEIKVINQFIYELIDADRLISFNKSDSFLIVYFNTDLGCNLDKNPLFQGEYKTNDLIKRLEKKSLGERVLDTSKIARLNNVKIVFEDKSDYSIEKYDSGNVIGTLNFSRISFNKNITIGYFYYDIYCGEDCGHGALIKIEKKNGKWKIIEYLISWVS